MPRPSSIVQLPPEILEQLQELLRNPRCSQAECADRVNRILEESGYEIRISKSAVNRYSMKMEEAGAKLRESREVAKMWIGKLGATPQGQVGQLVNEILRTLAFDLTLAVQGGGELDPEQAPAVAKMLKDMSIAMERLEKAASENRRREEDIRKEERERAAQIVEETGKAQGLDDDQVALWRERFLGVR